MRGRSMGSREVRREKKKWEILTYSPGGEGYSH